MQISITNQQKNALENLKLPRESLSAVVRQAIDAWIQKNKSYKQNLDTLLNEVTQPSGGESINQEAVNQWIKDLRKDRKIDL